MGQPSPGAMEEEWSLGQFVHGRSLRVWARRQQLTRQRAWGDPEVLGAAFPTGRLDLHGQRETAHRDGSCPLCREPHHHRGAAHGPGWPRGQGNTGGGAVGLGRTLLRPNSRSPPAGRQDRCAHIPVTGARVGPAPPPWLRAEGGAHLSIDRASRAAAPAKRHDRRKSSARDDQMWPCALATQVRVAPTHLQCCLPERARAGH